MACSLDRRKDNWRNQLTEIRITSDHDLICVCVSDVITNMSLDMSRLLADKMQSDLW